MAYQLLWESGKGDNLCLDAGHGATLTLAGTAAGGGDEEFSGTWAPASEGSSDSVLTWTKLRLLPHPGATTRTIPEQKVDVSPVAISATDRELTLQHPTKANAAVTLKLVQS